MTLPCAARSTLVYLERGDAPRCTKALSPFNQTSWQEMWCPGVILGPSNTQLRVSECLMWDYYMILSQLNGDPCPAWTTERGKLKRGWSPGDSLNLVRVLSVRVNYSQQCRNDINGRWEYSKSIMILFVLLFWFHWALFLRVQLTIQWNFSIKATQDGGLSKEVACHEG